MNRNRPRTIGVVTSSRADYGHLYWSLRELSARPDVSLQLFVTGAHLDADFGRTVDVIEADGFVTTERIECLEPDDSDVAMAKTIGRATSGFAEALGRHRPDLLVIIADRYEMLAPAAAAMALRIPIAHIEGGEASEGAIDQVVRNALTMMSHIHLTPTALATRRVLNMGEEAWRVRCVGAASLDHLQRSALLDPDVIAADLGLDRGQPIVVVGYHPVTIERDTTSTADAVYTALAQRSEQLVFCFPNADAGSRALVAKATAFCNDHSNARLHVNLAPVRYWSLLRIATMMLGNSSSGIMESPAVGIPAVNIGKRQRGREQAANIIQVEPDAAAIEAAMDRALSESFRVAARNVSNPYGDGRAAARIVEALTSIPIDQRLLEKPMPDA